LGDGSATQGLSPIPEGRRGSGHLEQGSPSDRITSVAREVGADLVVVGHHKQGVLSRWLKGSVTNDLHNSLQYRLPVARLEVSDEVLFSRTAIAGV
jgi:hypothetical protein